MHKLTFSIDIQAPRERVWKVLWDDKTFRDWTSVFTEGGEGSHIKSDWKKGSRFEFFESDARSYGIIEKLVPNKIISFKHLGEIRKGKEFPYDEYRLESYTLKENNSITTLILVHNIPEKHKSMFEDVIPKAFDRIKELAEQEAQNLSSNP